MVREERADAEPPQEISDVEEDTEDVEAAADILPIYEISSYGADYPVDALVQRLEANDITVPTWQREFIWTRRQCNRFVESLLLGLPVPGIFFYQDSRTGELVVLDGQQRLKTLQAYYSNDLEGKPFRLPRHDESRYQSIHPEFAGKRYAELPDEYRRRLDNAIIHATIVRQDAPAGPSEFSSIYHIFERINSGGTKLTPQEIRTAVYRGRLNDLIQELNDDDAWRGVYGRVSKRLRDQELILRYIALLTDSESYARPMTEFLNQFMAKHRDLEGLESALLANQFRSAIELLAVSVGDRLFRPIHAVNAAVFEATMVGLTRRIGEGGRVSDVGVRDAYIDLLENWEFQDSVLRATADDASVRNRLRLATEAFAKVG